MYITINIPIFIHAQPCQLPHIAAHPPISSIYSYIVSFHGFCAALRCPILRLPAIQPVLVARLLCYILYNSQFPRPGFGADRTTQVARAFRRVRRAIAKLHVCTFITMRAIRHGFYEVRGARNYM